MIVYCSTGDTSLRDFYTMTLSLPFKQLLLFLLKRFCITKGDDHIAKTNGYTTFQRIFSTFSLILKSPEALEFEALETKQLVCFLQILHNTK